MEINTLRRGATVTLIGILMVAVLTLGVLLLLCLGMAIGLWGYRQGTISNIRMTTDETGETPTTSYAPDAAFVVSASLNYVQKLTVVRADW
jgi:hypothetical protein